MFSPFGQRHSAHWFYAGFHEMHNTGQGGMESAEAILPRVQKWMKEHALEDNWYLHINFWDPHTPYRVPASYGDPFAKEPLPAWLDDDDLIKRHNKMVGPHTSLDLAMYDDVENPKFPRQPGSVKDRAGMRRMIDGYDTGVRYADDAIGAIIAILKEAGTYEDTAVIISADHGESLGELGLYAEHGTADDSTCHVPMVIKFPGGVKGKRDAALHYQLDLAPTLMELLGGTAQPLWDGQSFASSVKKGETKGREDLVLGQCAHVCQRSVLWDKWLYIRTYHDGFHLFPEEMLFDLGADPHEQENLAQKKPEICREGFLRLHRWHETQMQKMAEISTDAVDPLWTVIREGGPMHAGFGPGNSAGVAGFERYLKRLEATGRSDGAKLLRIKYAKQIEKTPA
jgi:choline-sulfatase